MFCKWVAFWELFIKLWYPSRDYFRILIVIAILMTCQIVYKKKTVNRECMKVIHSDPGYWYNVQYAGDSVDTIESCLNVDLANVKNWLRVNKLTLNMPKTELMLIRLRQRLRNFTHSPTPVIGGSPIYQERKGTLFKCLVVLALEH